MPHAGLAEFLPDCLHPGLRADRELSAGTVIDKLGMEQANVSPHNCNVAGQITVNRKAGDQVFYSVRDPLIGAVLALRMDISKATETCAGDA